MTDNKKKRKIAQVASLVILFFMTGTAAIASEKILETENAGRGFFAGIGGGTVLGQGTFRSLGSYATHFGYELSGHGGYRLNDLLSIEAAVTAGKQSQTTMDCCQYWLSTDHTRYFAPIIDEKGWYYRYLESCTSWQRYSLQLDINLLALFTEKREWRMELAPRISAFSTLTMIRGPLSDGSGRLEQGCGRQWHLGLGGQLCASHKIGDRMELGLYLGIDCLGGERFDRIPVHCHKSNLIYDGGLRLTWFFQKKSLIPRQP